MTSTSPCASASPCASPVAERPRYFPRQIITPDDLMLEQEYFRNKMRRHNRLMHGWGVVCGAKVCLTPQAGSTVYQPWMVTVTSGYILGPYGDEIVIDCCKTVDLRTSGTTGMTGDPCVQPTDPWCTDVYVQRPSGPVYVAVKYKECKTRPVRVQPVGCGCNDNSCEYSRLQDGYEIGILTSCPDAGEKPPADLNVIFQGGTPDCPDCPQQPWVVLAQVTVSSDGTVTLIDNCVCRRIVASFAEYWRQCPPNPYTITGFASPTPGTNLKQVAPGTMNLITVATIPTLNTAAPYSADLGQGVANIVAKPTGNPGELGITFDVQSSAQPGPRTLVVAAGGASATFPNAITIALPAKMAPPLVAPSSSPPLADGSATTPGKKKK